MGDMQHSQIAIEVMTAWTMNMDNTDFAISRANEFLDEDPDGVQRIVKDFIALSGLLLTSLAKETGSSGYAIPDEMRAILGDMALRLRRE